VRGSPIILHHFEGRPRARPLEQQRAAVVVDGEEANSAISGKELKGLGLGDELLAWVAHFEHDRGAIMAHPWGHIVERHVGKGRVQREGPTLGAVTHNARQTTQPVEAFVAMHPCAGLQEFRGNYRSLVHRRTLSTFLSHLSPGDRLFAPQEAPSPR
jgi:hypothetical protein